MRLAKFLLDTNILIPVEDAKQTPPSYAELLRELQAKGHSVFTHQASIADIQRDKDEHRRAVSLSKLRKYNLVRSSWRADSDLSREFGDIKNKNDLCDTHMLASLKDGVVDFLVTEDSGLHTRARRHALDARVLYVREALDQLTGAYARVDYNLRSITRKYCYQLDPNDQIFLSLKDDYPAFDIWWEKCRSEHRECWVVSDATQIAALCVFKEETQSEAARGVSGSRIFKISTFKVSEAYRGGRLGEQLLRQCLCYGYDAGYDTLYLTVFPKQQGLRELIRYYGFRRVSTQANGELVYAKLWDRRAQLDASHFRAVRRAYPAFPSSFAAGVIVPVRPGYHDRLFPEARSKIRNVPGELFTGAWSQGNAARSSPSNSISKAYLSHARLTDVQPGSLIVFYRSQDREFGVPSSAIAVGISESYTQASDYQRAIELISNRSVYSDDEIQLLVGRPKLKVLRFLFYGYLQTPLSLQDLTQMGALGGPPQSFVRVASESLEALAATVRSRLVSA